MRVLLLLLLALVLTTTATSPYAGWSWTFNSAAYDEPCPTTPGQATECNVCFAGGGFVWDTYFNCTESFVYMDMFLSMNGSCIEPLTPKALAVGCNHGMIVQLVPPPETPVPDYVKYLASLNLKGDEAEVFSSV